MTPFSFNTDTATLCIFDPIRLKHRLNDDADWWSMPSDEIAEVNKGNVVFVGLGTDGKFTMRFVDSLRDAHVVKVRLSVDSGRVFVGAGEEVTSDGLEPECLRGGAFLDVSSGVYMVSLSRTGSKTLEFSLTKVEGSPENSITHPLKIDWPN